MKEEDQWDQPQILKNAGKAIGHYAVMAWVMLCTLILFGGMVCPLFWKKISLFCDDVARTAVKEREDLMQDMRQNKDRWIAEMRKDIPNFQPPVDWEERIAKMKMSYEPTRLFYRRLLGWTLAIWFVVSWVFFILVIAPQIH